MEFKTMYIPVCIRKGYRATINFVGVIGLQISIYLNTAAEIQLGAPFSIEVLLDVGKYLCNYSVLESTMF